MKTFEYIFFDCMETLVDLQKLPALKDYAGWAYYGSGAEELWCDFDDFFRYYLLSRQDISSRLPEYAEYDIRDRFLRIAELSFRDMSYTDLKSISGLMYENYWRNYKSGSYVRQDVLQTLPEMWKQYRMGVVSNFMVMDGIEELLEMHGILKHFDFVVTSVKEGWCKPHAAIYEKALKLAGVNPDQVVFVGDDFVNDYTAPSGFGMKTVLLDRFNRHPELESRAGSFTELYEKLISLNI